MSAVRVVKKGDFVFKEGDKIQSLILVQSGSVQLCLARPKKNVDLSLVGPNQVLGEQALVGGTYNYSAIAVVETKVIDLPADAYRGQVEASSQILKTVVKSLTDRLKGALAEVRTYKMEKDGQPCPEDQVAKVFGTIFHTARHKGTIDPKSPNKSMIDWLVFRQYSQRVFGESLKRLESATQILVKLKLARYEMGKPPENPEGPDEVQKFFVEDLSAVESFFEYFQYYYFKGGKTDLLKSDDLATNYLSKFVALGEKLEADRFGVVAMEFSKVIETFKTEFGMPLNNDHLARLESKGLFMKRKARADGTVDLSFEIKEFQTTAKIWRILREIEKWNERGFVDVNEQEVTKKKSDGPSCPDCQASVAPQAKFCQECGCKLTPTAKAA